jgi:hypothetical protein
MKARYIRNGILILIVCIAGFSCDDETGTSESVPVSSSVNQLPPAPTETLTIGGETYTVELAFQRHVRQKGLMFRDQLEPNTGMLFVFAHEKPRVFYMKNCLIDLDILFMKASGEIAQITTMKVPEPGKPLIYYRCETPVQYAMELSAGTVACLGLEVGRKIALTRRIRNILPDPD